MVEGTASFEAVATVQNEIQQTLAGDLSAKTYIFLLIPAAA